MKVLFLSFFSRYTNETESFYKDWTDGTVIPNNTVSYCLSTVQTNGFSGANYQYPKTKFLQSIMLDTVSIRYNISVFQTEIW